MDRIIGKKGKDGKMEIQSFPGSMGEVFNRANETPVPLESTYSADRLKDMSQRLELLQATVRLEKEKWGDKLERLESELAQGGDVNEADLDVVRDKAMLYGNLESAFAGSGKGDAPARIEHAIDRIRAIAPQSPDSHRAKLDEAVETLRGLL